MCIEHLVQCPEHSESSIPVNYCCYCYCGIHQIFHNCLCLYLAALTIICEGRDSELFIVIFSKTSTVPGISWAYHILER